MRVITRRGSERIAKKACDLVARRRKLTIIHKSNVLKSDCLFLETCRAVAAGRGVLCDDMLVDAAAYNLVVNPQRFDVLVTTNLFGDILTDLAGAVCGGVGFAASANMNPMRTAPSMFEPDHGAAHDIAGQNKANPLAAIVSSALMLEHLGEDDAAQKIFSAVREYADHSPQTDASTTAVGDAIAGKV